MPLRFSYRTFSTFSPVAEEGSSVEAVGGEVIVRSSSWALNFVKSFSKRSVTISGISASPCDLLVGCRGASNKGAQAGDGFAEDQILDLIRTFVGVKRLGVREKARSLVVCDDAVAAQQLAGPRNGLATFRRGECFGERGMGVRQLAFGMQLRLAHDQAL